MTEPDYKMYDTILPAFMKYMRAELEANYKKGDRNLPNGWLSNTSNKSWISELYYHIGKLQAALMTNDIQRIIENCADIANLAMMTLDVKIDLLAVEEANKVSATPEAARAYLIEQGLDPDALVANGLLKIAEIKSKITP